MKYIIIFIFILYTGSITAVPSKRIWNGNDAAEPMLHVCTLFVVNDNPAVGYLGGGTIISNKHVLTAAHVLEKVVEIKIGYGSNIRAEMKTITTKTYFINSEYDPKTRANDIAIIMLLTETFEDGFFQAAIIFDGSSFTFPGKGTVAGFGYYTPDAKIPDVLQYAEIEVQDNSFCNKFVNADLTNDFCVFSSKLIPSHLCPGDNGIGFFTIEKVEDINDETIMIDVPVLFGIASHIVQGCTLQDQPAAFEKVEKHITWIQIFVPPN